MVTMYESKIKKLLTENLTL